MRHGTLDRVTPEPPLVSIVIPAYRQPLLRACLESIRGLLGDGVPFDVHVVLNDVPDRIRAIPGAFPDLPLVVHDLAANFGSNGGLNVGFAASAAPYLLPVQDDSTVEPGLLAVLLERLEAEPDIGASAALVTTFDGLVHDAGWMIWRDATATPRWAGSSRDPRHFPECRAVAHHGTHASLFRREAWESIGGFDDAFYPALYGDVDASLSLRRRGWRIVVDPRARSSQRVNGSTTPSFAAFLLHRHLLRLREKHGAWLASAPQRVEAAADVARAMAHVAAQPVGPRPEPPSAAELSNLAQRLDQTVEQFIRRERDVLAEYRSYLEARYDGERATANVLRRDLVRCRRDQEELGRTTIALDDLRRDYDTIVQSRSWRWTSAARAIARRARRS